MAVNRQLEIDVEKSDGPASANLDRSLNGSATAPVGTQATDGNERIAVIRLN